MASEINRTNLTLEYQALVDQDKAIRENMDEFFLLIMGIIVFLMQAGFAFLEAGSVRAKNTTNIILKNMVVSCIGGIFYWLFGWALAYGQPSHAFAGYGQWANPPEPKLAFWFFQFVFAATSATIVSGSVAERCDFAPFIIYAAFQTGFIYPIESHWVWAPDGWLKNIGGDDIGFKDFAGSGVVHVNGGTMALVAAFLLGPRIGKFEGKKIKKISGHSVALIALGCLLLMFGFFAFNGGSQNSISHKEDGIIVSRAMLNTIICGAAAGLTVLIINRFRSGKWSILVTINGILAGMVAVCAGANVMYPWGAAAVGTGAGMIYLLVAIMTIFLKIDDPLEAGAVHLGGGFWGCLMRPFFDMNDGIFFNFNRQSGLFLAWNLIGATAIMAWCAGWAFLIFGIMRATGLLRVKPDVEKEGLDIRKHGEPVYPTAAYADGEDWESVKQTPIIVANNNRCQSAGVNGGGQLTQRTHAAPAQELASYPGTSPVAAPYHVDYPPADLHQTPQYTSFRLN